MNYPDGRQINQVVRKSLSCGYGPDQIGNLPFFLLPVSFPLGIGFMNGSPLGHFKFVNALFHEPEDFTR